MKLPTRVLHISKVEGAIRVRVRETELDERGLYVCLSYSWGARPGLQQEFAKLGNSLSTEDMSTDRLPQTFRDAVLVCQDLGLCHLWIDALCIQQGDEADKSKELPAMNHYYSNAHLVIQSSGTRSVDDGFLGISRIPRISRQLLKIRDETSLACSLEEMSFVEKKPDFIPEVTFYSVPFISQDNVSDNILLYELSGTDWYSPGAEPAASRGWVLQEELLGKRILIFPSTGGMIFRCVGEDNMLTDANVICHPDSHQPLAFHKKMLWGKDEDRLAGLSLIPEGVKGFVQQARKLATAGGNHPLVTCSGTSAGLILNHDFSTPLEVPKDGYVIAPVYSEAKGGVGSASRSVSSCAALLIFEDVKSEESDGQRLQSQLIFTDTPPHAISAQGANEAWLDTVDNYCSRRLTNPGDKLPAIAALAREYSTRYKQGLGRYIAGAWEAFLGRSLIWRVPLNRIEPHPAGSRAPSWSWAAVEGATFEGTGSGEEYDLKSSSIEIKIKGAKIRLEAAGLEYESVKEGTLEIQGKILECSWSQPDPEDGFVLFDESTKEQLGGRSLAFPDCVEDAKDESGLLFLLVRRSNRGIGKHDDRFEGPVLRRVDNGDYTRVGYARWYSGKETFEETMVARFREETINIF